MKTPFFLRIALNNLRRGGQRVWVALLCIAFGVMSLVAMTLLSQSIDRALVLKPSEWMGGDASLTRQDGKNILPEQEKALKELQQKGSIEKYTLEAVTSSLLFRSAGGSDYHPVSNGIGIDPAVYPLAGNITFSDPGNIGLAGLLQEPGDTLVTIDIAKNYALKVGDVITLSTLDSGIPVAGHVRGILSDTPNHLGNKIYYTLATAERLTGTHPAANTALVRSNHLKAMTESLGNAGWDVYSGSQLTEQNQSETDLFDLLLKGAGILGLLVGGIGIANTMQVLLRRRRQEIAIWKSLGYTQRDLQALFVMEAAILGIMGSLAGAVLGIVVAYQLVNLFSRTGNLLISMAVSPSILTLSSSILVGISTSIIFALWAIVSASKVSPLALLRNEPGNNLRQTWKQNLLLLLALGLPFTAVISLIMGSWIKGIGVLLFAVAGLLVLGGLLTGLTWGVARILPFRSLSLLHIAQTRLGRHAKSLVFAMIALFTGVVTLSLGVVVTSNAQRVMSEHSMEVKGYTIALIAPATQEIAIQQALVSRNIHDYTLGYQTSVKSIAVAGSTDANAITPMLVGRAPKPYDYEVHGSAWGTIPDGVYLPAWLKPSEGAEVKIILQDGTTRVFHVAGTYNLLYEGTQLPPPAGVLLPADMSQKLAPPDTLLLYVQTPLRQTAETATALGKTLPGVTVMDLLVYAARFTQVYQNLFVLALAMSGLALLAGVLLVANSVSLAMLERRYEIGIYKAIGYSRAQVQGMLAAEYGWIALIASAAGIAVVSAFLWVMGRLNPLAGGLLVLPPASAAAICASCIALILLTVIGVTWKTTQVAPLVILNDRG